MDTLTKEIVVTNPEREKKEMDAVEKVRRWEIKSNEDYSALDSFLVGLNELKKEIVADFKESKAAAKAAHQAICDQESAHLDKLEEARIIGKPKLVAWRQEQERKDEEERRRLEAEAQKKRDEEALAQAQAAEKSGDKEAAQAIIEKAAAAPAPVVKVEPTLPKAKTVSQERWSGVGDPAAVKEAVAKVGAFLAKSKTAEGKEAAALLRDVYKSIDYMVFDGPKVNRQAVATKDAIKILGVTFSSRRV